MSASWAAISSALAVITGRSKAEKSITVISIESRLIKRCFIKSSSLPGQATTMSMPLAFFAKRKTGDIFARFQENQTIRNFLTESTVTTLLNLLMVFIYFTIMFLYNVKMTLVDPLETAPPDQLDAGYYERKMRENIDNLAKALK